jgi:hypothetical protein
MQQNIAIPAGRSEVLTSANGRAYFVGRFKANRYGRQVSRTFWGQEQEGGATIWERVSPAEFDADLKAGKAVGVRVFAIDHLPVTFTGRDGTAVTTRTTSVVGFDDETDALVAKRYKLPLEEAAAAQAESLELVAADEAEAPF